MVHSLEVDASAFPVEDTGATVMHLAASAGAVEVRICHLKP